MTTVEKIKELLSEPKFRIKLYDYIEEQCSIATSRTSSEVFQMGTSWSPGELASRLERYEESTADLVSAMALVGFWGSAEHLTSYSIPARHFGPQIVSTSGNSVWIALRWYPLLLIMYSLGIGAIAGNNLNSLYGFFQTTIGEPSNPALRIPLVLAVPSEFSSARDSIKFLPGRERQFTPLSEYLFNFFQTKLHNVIFMGNEYEDIFDRFELLLALQHAHQKEKISPGRVWGPIGRFGWKYRRGVGSGPYQHLRDEASRAKESWPPLKAGFFDASYDRFEEIASQYSKILQSLPWH
jgi:hypothetical protein